MQIKARDRIEGRPEHYGCDGVFIGCVLYKVLANGTEIKIDKEYYYERDRAMAAAKKLGRKLNLPVVMESIL